MNDLTVEQIAANVVSLEASISRIALALEQISEGLFQLNLRLGADVSPWAPNQVTRLETNSDAKTGTVKWFDSLQGFGFIIPDGFGTDVFVHQSGMVPPLATLRERQRVEFNVVEGQHGPMAMNVCVIG